MVAMFTTWASPSLSIFHSSNSPLGRFITEEEGAWVVSSYFLGIIPAGVFGGFLLNRIGRRTVLLCCSFLLCPPWILISFAINTEVIYVARFLAGMAGSLLVFAAMIYCNEIIPEGQGMDQLESYMVSYKMLGTAFILLTNPYISYQVLAVICAIQPIILFCLLLLIPESPYFLMLKGDKEGALSAMNSIASVQTLSGYLLVSPIKRLQKKLNYNLTHKITTIDFLFGSKFRHPLIVVAGMKILQQCSGWTAISGYMPDIINLTTSMFHWNDSSLIFGGVLIPATISVGSIINMFGRKPVIAISSIAAGVALTLEGSYFYFQDISKIDTSQIAWLPTGGIAAFLIFYNLGIGSEINMACSELFPPNTRIMMLATTTTFEGIIAFIVTKIYKWMSRLVGVHVIMWFFATQCLLGAVFAVVFLPETKGKRSVTEIKSCVYTSVDIDEYNDTWPIISTHSLEVEN
ncbi:facilitated trehalose transporter Tret1-like isoform X2 [Onthophagus taurus]|nr:facilitated trehalose transporter Tret1-like isoform X2 [Onthophagus taurus]